MRSRFEVSRALAEIQAILFAQRQVGIDRQRADDAKGRVGEILVEAWLRANPILEVFAVPQRGDKLEWVSADAKRPDFLVLMPQDEGDPIPILFDAKFHTIKDDVFYLSMSEYGQYAALMREWTTKCLFYAVIRADRPTLIYFIEHSELRLEAAGGRYVIDVESRRSTTEPVSAEDYRRACEQAQREKYAVELLPDYPTV